MAQKAGGGGGGADRPNGGRSMRALPDGAMTILSPALMLMPPPVPLTHPCL